MDIGKGNAITVAVYAALIYDIISATNSSPQTTELNAAARADTLMKWVKLGLAQGALFAGLGVALELKDGNPPWPPLLGAGLAVGLMWIQYVHAKNSGLKSVEPGTEVYQNPLVTAAEGGAVGGTTAAIVSGAL